MTAKKPTPKRTPTTRARASTAADKRAAAKRGTAKRRSKAAKASVDWAPGFLSALANTGNVRAACNAAQIGRSAVYDRRRGDPAFARAWVSAIAEAGDLLEAEARRRALHGTSEPIVGRIARDQDGVVTTVQKYSDSLLMFLLKGAKPEVYRERLEVRHMTVDAIDAEIDRLREELAAKGGEVPVE